MRKRAQERIEFVIVAHGVPRGTRIEKCCAMLGQTEQ